MNKVFCYGLVDSVKENFEVLDTSEFKTDSKRETPSQQYWVFKHKFTASEAQLWCLRRKLETLLNAIK